MRALGWTIGAAMLLGVSVGHADTNIIDPNNFSVGQNISFATPGVQMFSISAIQNPNWTGGLYPYLPTLGLMSVNTVGPDAIGSSCVGGGYGGIPCSPIGPKVFSTYSGEVTWGNFAEAAGCLALSDCTPTHGYTNMGVGGGIFIDFNTPTDYVSMLGSYWTENGSGLEAFNSAGQEVGFCSSIGNTGLFNGTGCASVDTGDLESGWATYSISNSSPDISYVVMGGNDFGEVAQVQYHSQPLPEPGSLGLLALGVGAVGFSRLRKRARAYPSQQGRG